MLDVTLDLITQTASSSLFAFCCCNLIIVIILVGSKPASEETHTSPLSLPSNTLTNDKEVLLLETNEKQVENPKGVSNELVVVSEVSNVQKNIDDDGEKGNNVQKNIDDDGEKGNNDNDNDHHEGEDVEEKEEEEEEDDDDELRKRVEEFIQKVNREWKAELLRTSNLVEA